MNRKKYYYDEHFFEVINSESNAYYLGLLYADGYVNDKLDYVELTLLEKDFKILERFYFELKSNRKPIYIRNDKYCRLIINSKKIVKDLIMLGCTNNKTHTLNFPDNINENLTHHMIRGYFDGDGSIWCDKRNQYHVQFDGNLNFISGVKKFLNKNLFIENKQVSKRHLNSENNIVVLKYGGNCLTKKIFDLLYDDATLYLERKYEKFLSVICQQDYVIEYDGVHYSKHNVSNLYDIIETISGLKRSKIRSRFNSGWNVNEIIEYGVRDKNKVSVSKYNLNDEFLNTYISLEEAARKNNCNSDSISRNAKKNRKYKNYYWRINK